MLRVTAATLLALALAGCGAAPTGAALRAPAGMQAAAASPLAAAFDKALAAKYGKLYTPAGAKVRVKGVESYKIQGGETRVRGVIVVETKDFTAELDAMAALGKGDKVTADYFPRFKQVAFEGQAQLDEAATFAVRIQRMDRAQLGQSKDLGAVVDPKKYTVKVLPLDKSHDDLAEVSFMCEGFLGKGSTFTEFYRVKGKANVITDVTYNDNKATDPNGNDLDG